MTEKDQKRVSLGQKPLQWELLLEYFKRIKKNLGDNLEMDSSGGPPKFNGWERAIEEIVI
jgi:hypothetical protein